MACLLKVFLSQLHGSVCLALHGSVLTEVHKLKRSIWFLMHPKVSFATWLLLPKKKTNIFTWAQWIFANLRAKKWHMESWSLVRLCERKPVIMISSPKQPQSQSRGVELFCPSVNTPWVIWRLCLSALLQDALCVLNNVLWGLRLWEMLASVPSSWYELHKQKGSQLQSWVHSNIIASSHSHIHMLSTSLRNILLTKLLFLLLQSQLDKSSDSSTCRVNESWGQAGLFLICPRGTSSGQIWCLEAAETALAAGVLEVTARALFLKKQHSQLEAMTHSVHINQITLHIINRP